MELLIIIKVKASFSKNKTQIPAVSESVAINDRYTLLAFQLTNMYHWSSYNKYCGYAWGKRSKGEINVPAKRRHKPKNECKMEKLSDDMTPLYITLQRAMSLGDMACKDLYYLDLSSFTLVTLASLYSYKLLIRNMKSLAQGLWLFLHFYWTALLPNIYMVSTPYFLWVSVQVISSRALSHRVSDPSSHPVLLSWFYLSASTTETTCNVFGLGFPS